MALIAEIIGGKMQLLKDQLGLSNEDLGEILGVTRQTVSKYLKGEQVIDSARLFKLAKFANVSLNYFMEEEDHHSDHSFMFRADNPKENIDGAFYNFINKKLNAYWGIMELADEIKITYTPDSYHLEIEKQSLSEEEKEIIREVADKQRKAFGVEGDLKIDIYSVLDRNNIHVYAFEYADNKIDALSAHMKNQGAFILLNDYAPLPEERKMFSVAHELGHLIFHRNQYNKKTEELVYQNYQKELNEKVANQFASYFLIPRDILHEYRFYFKKSRYFAVNDLIKLKQEFGVSAKAMLLALKEEQYISNRIYGYLLKQLNQSGYDKKEPSPMEKIEKNQRLKFVLKNLLLQEKISLNKVAEVLSLDLKSARNLAKEWAKLNEYPKN